MKRIRMLSIDLSNYCSKECDFCYNHSTKSGSAGWKPEEVIFFAKDCIKKGIEAISLGGGEPFEFEGIFDIISELVPIVYLSVTTNGLPLLQEHVWKNLMLHSPDKIHITIHRPEDEREVARVMMQLNALSRTDIKPGLNLLVSNDCIDDCKNVYQTLREILNPDQIILVPRRLSKTPTPAQLADITSNTPFQSASCLLACNPPSNFVSVSWNKKVNRCSYAGGKVALEELSFEGLIGALDKVKFKTCL